MFKIFPWNKNLEIGIGEIDKQHRMLLAILNRLANEATLAPNQESIKKQCEELAELAQRHFETEEAIWTRYLNNEEIQQERMHAHQTFIKKVSLLIKQLDKQDAKHVAKHALEYLAEWLILHIVDADRYMAHVMQSKIAGLSDQAALALANEKIRSHENQTLLRLISDLYVKNAFSRIQNIHEIDEQQRTNTALKRQQSYREFILQLAVSLINLPTENIDAVIEHALAQMSVLLNTDRAHVFEYDFVNQTLSNTHEWCAEGVEPMIEKSQQLPLSLSTNMLPEHLSGQVGIIPSVFDLPKGPFRDLLEFQDIKSLITMPLMISGQCTGFVGFDSTKKLRSFDQEEQGILALFTSLVSNIKQRKVMEEHLARKTDELAESHKRLVNILDGTDAVVYVADIENHEVLFVNKKGRELVGDITGKTCWRAIQGKVDGPCSFCTNPQLINQAGEANSPVVWEHFNEKTNRWFQLHDQAIPWDDGRLVRLEIAIDITDKKSLERSLRQSEERYRSLFEQSRDALMIISPPDWTFIDGNRAMVELFGAENLKQLRPLTPIDLSPSQQPCGRSSMELCLEKLKVAIQDGSCFFEWLHQRLDGKIINCAVLLTRTQTDGQMLIQGTVRDITEQKVQQRQLERIAHYDILTSMPNRVLLSDRMQKAMANARRTDKVLAVAYLDIDGFKLINDRHGHNSGDRFLVQLAKRLQLVLRETDTLARIGGDEFVIVMGDFQSPDASLPVFDRLLEEASVPFVDDDITFQVSASLGITFYPQADAIDADQLLRQADQAMYQAKLAGKNRYHLFDLINDQAQRGHHANIARIQRALETEEFVLFYQPKVNMLSGEILGVEALIRWQHPKKGLLGPCQFLPLIEGHSLEVAVDNWVLESALMQMSNWNKQGIKLPISINISASQLQHPDFVATLNNALQRYPNCSPQDLQLEILESSALGDLELVIQVMNECISLGVHFALDDFGTGYSSLTYLKRLPANTLKIDKSFVRDMLDDDDDYAILEGVLGLSRAFRRLAVAEGVETIDQGKALLKLGCEVAQGYCIAKPQPAADIVLWIDQWRTPGEWKV
ncbi:EAL domain-containing protein [Nitrincola schmidtii]|uniref:EAL domain-containing protein n=1 Tax=Nitrincola schmidtii TaxID=1730894 RepID=UPI0014567EDF|nr:EAL domain-containing protein [Nitrincola schmidtii]